MNEVIRDVTLDDKYVNEDGSVYITGIQTLVRLPLDQVRLDKTAGLKTAGFISGYRGSPLGGYDSQLERAQKFLDKHNIVFKPGVNEELGATAVWGTQKLGKSATTKYDGVFGIWYGKAPGVDRAGDVLKHANMSGTHHHGGVLALAGDDLLAKSSTLPAQSEFALMDAEVPVFNPSDLQDVLDYGLLAIALSRYSGLWSGMICYADTMDSSGIINVDLSRHNFVMPQYDPRAERELNRALILANRFELEELTRDIKLPAVHHFIKANKLNALTFGSKTPRVLLTASGKAYRDLLQALDLLGISDKKARDLGLGVYKVGMSWPFETSLFMPYAKKAERIIVVEHKRALIETQIKSELYHLDAKSRPDVYGKRLPNGKPLFPDILELSPDILIQNLLNALPKDMIDANMRKAAKHVKERYAFANENATDATRSPYFCSGCPHNTSTVTPEGSKSMAGIGCHIMTEMADRTTESCTQMGGEGVPWIGMEPFTNEKHMFVNLGDGTYFHSGILAIRQAIGAKSRVTYKILYNDAVAMTGGQAVDGQLSVPQLTRQMDSEGVELIYLVSENPDQYTSGSGLAKGTRIHHRDDLMAVQKECQEFDGVSVIVYDQTCAAEKRRRRKRGLYPTPDHRLFINERVCEGCGDCSVQSNCISVEPLETVFGQKRKINQSSCNLDFSCVKGFCPSFVSVYGASLKRADTNEINLNALSAELPEPQPYLLENTYDVLITGIGGMGVTTTSAVMAMAAHLDGLNALTLDMTGLAQKGGPVTSHVRFAPKNHDINGAHIPQGNLSTLLAADMLVANYKDTLTLTDPQKTVTVANAQISPTAEFVRFQSLSFNKPKMEKVLREASKEYFEHDFADLAEKLFGDTLYANIMLVGFGVQKGLIPLTRAGMENAIMLNRAAVKLNLGAFTAGRVLAHNPAAFNILQPTKKETPAIEKLVNLYTKELEGYQNEKYARLYKNIISDVKRIDRTYDKNLALTKAVAKNLYKLMAYKDEYEVARLYSSSEFLGSLNSQFDDIKKMKVSLAPPLISRIDPITGRPQKRAFGPWIFTAFKYLEKLKVLRGTPLDIFGYTEERKTERQLRDTYIQNVNDIIKFIHKGNYNLAVQILSIPQEIKGFGPVKEKNIERAKKSEKKLIDRFYALPKLMKENTKQNS